MTTPNDHTHFDDRNGRFIFDISEERLKNRHVILDLLRTNDTKLENKDNQ